VTTKQSLVEVKLTTARGTAIGSITKLVNVEAVKPLGQTANLASDVRATVLKPRERADEGSDPLCQSSAVPIQAGTNTQRSSRNSHHTAHVLAHQYSHCLGHFLGSFHCLVGLSISSPTFSNIG
jgi:hypothetical protein